MYSKVRIKLLASCLTVACVILLFSNIAYAIFYYPECAELPRYDSLGYYVSKYGRDENQVLQLENGKQAYSMYCSSANSDGQGYIKKLVNEYGWNRITSSSKNNTGYSVMEKNSHYIGVAIFYGPNSTSDGIRIYPNLGNNHSNSEPIFYNEYTELPMYSLISSCQCKYRFTTPSNTIGFAYGEDISFSYQSIIEDVYGWYSNDQETIRNRDESIFAYMYVKNNVKICVADVDDNVYIFEYKGKLTANDIKNYVNYGMKHQTPIKASSETSSTNATTVITSIKNINFNTQMSTSEFDQGMAKGIDYFNRGLYYEARDEFQWFCDYNWGRMNEGQQKYALDYLGGAKQKVQQLENQQRARASKTEEKKHYTQEDIQKAKDDIDRIMNSGEDYEFEQRILEHEMKKIQSDWWYGNR